MPSVKIRVKDEELVARLRARDATAFARILDAWSPGMHRLAAVYVGSSASADEVVQETWLAVIENVAAFEGGSTLKHWVYRIVANTAKRQALREHLMVPMEDPVGATRPSVEPSRFRSGEELFPGHWRDFPAQWPTPEEADEATETRKVVLQALQQLPPRQAAAVTLRDVEGFEAEETAALLGTTVADQRVLLHRGRAAIRSVLEEYLGRCEAKSAPDESGRS